MAFYVSIAVSLGALFLLGAAGGKLSRTHVFRSGARMFIIGGIAIMVGIFIGKVAEGL